MGSRTMNESRDFLGLEPEHGWTRRSNEARASALGFA